MPPWGNSSWFAMCCFDQRKLLTLLDLCASSLRNGHANIICFVPILTDDPRRESLRCVVFMFCVCVLLLVLSVTCIAIVVFDVVYLYVLTYCMLLLPLLVIIIIIITITNNDNTNIKLCVCPRS